MKLKVIVQIVKGEVSMNVYIAGRGGDWQSVTKINYGFPQEENSR